MGLLGNLANSYMESITKEDRYKTPEGDTIPIGGFKPTGLSSGTTDEKIESLEKNIKALRKDIQKLHSARN